MGYKTVGSFAGVARFKFTTASQDSGVLVSTVPALGLVNAVQSNLLAGELVPGMKSTLFQLLPGDMSAGAITIYGTIDINTANGTAQNWEPLVAPSVETADDTFAYYNPLSATAGQRTLLCTAPWAAYRAFSNSAYVGTTAALLVFVGP